MTGVRVKLLNDRVGSGSAMTTDQLAMLPAPSTPSVPSVVIERLTDSEPTERTPVYVVALAVVAANTAATAKNPVVASFMNAPIQNYRSIFQVWTAQTALRNRTRLGGESIIRLGPLRGKKRYIVQRLRMSARSDTHGPGARGRRRCHVQDDVPLNSVWTAHSPIRRCERSA